MTTAPQTPMTAAERQRASRASRASHGGRSIGLMLPARPAADLAFLQAAHECTASVAIALALKFAADHLRPVRESKPARLSSLLRKTP